MYHTIADFVTTWQDEAENTEKILSALTDESLDKRLISGLRTIAQLVWHLLETAPEMLGHTGLKIDGPEYLSKPLKTVSELIKEHQKVVKSVAHEVQTHWNNKSLHLTDQMYGEEWTRSQTLTALVDHLIHHRGQLTVFMRLAGLKVPGIYGPAKEEWAQYGMQAPNLD